MQFGRGKRLRQEITGACRKRRKFCGFVSASCEQDDGNALGVGAFAQFFASLQPIFFRHHHIQQDNVWQELAGFFDRLLPIDRLDHLVLAAQLRFEESQHIRFIICDQDFGPTNISAGLQWPQRILHSGHRREELGPAVEIGQPFLG